MNFNERLIRALRLKGLTQSDLSRMLQVDRSTVSAWTRGRSFPRLAMLKRIADALECTVSDLMDEQSATHLFNEFVQTLTPEQKKILLDELRKSQ